MTTTQLEQTKVSNDVVIHGTCDQRFQQLHDFFARNLSTGEDIGASAAVFIDGKPLVDLWGGYADEARTQPWESDTIVNTFSTTKTMTALCALILIDQGKLDPDAPVVKYWPEFAANGKEHVKVRHFLSHSAGLPAWTAPMTLADILDREKATTRLAEQACWWEPGTKAGYHSITFGPLIGELVRRVTGKTLTRFFADDVAGPLGADFHIGAPAEADSRVSKMIAASPIIPRTGDPIQDGAFFNPYVRPADAGTIAWRRGELGGSNGHGNARSAAAVQSVLSNGGEARGVRLLSRAGCERALEVQGEEMPDLVFFGYPLRWGLGYALENPFLNAMYANSFAGRRVALWGGSGGSIVVNDFDARMTVAYVMNRHVEGGGNDPRGTAIVTAAFEAL